MPDSVIKSPDAVFRAQLSEGDCSCERHFMAGAVAGVPGLPVPGVATPDAALTTRRLPPASFGTRRESVPSANPLRTATKGGCHSADIPRLPQLRA